MKSIAPLFFFTVLAMTSLSLQGSEAKTSILRQDIRFPASEKGYVVLKRADIEAVVVDNRAVDDEILPGHAAGYHGLAALRHTKQSRNIFVPTYAGLNFEHIHDGSVKDRDILFEPRKAPIRLRIIDEHTVDLYQPPTPYWGLESCLRYHLLEDGTIQMTFECIPRKDTFKNGYCGLFWASYIDRPESLNIHFMGIDESVPFPQQPTWQEGITPSHGTLATHRGIHDPRAFPHAPDFPLTLAFGFSKKRYTEPWYFGVCRDMAFLYQFQREDHIWLTQSPSGGGLGCPAWDFQWFIPNPQKGEVYCFTMKANYIPLEEPDNMESVRKQIGAGKFFGKSIH